MKKSKKAPQYFIGQETEVEALQNINQKGEATILIIQARRRVGKTLLIEFSFRNEKNLKIEVSYLSSVGGLWFCTLAFSQ